MSKKKVEDGVLVNKAKFLWNDFVKILKRCWDLGVDVATFIFQVLTFWELFINSSIGKSIGLFLSGLKFR